MKKSEKIIVITLDRIEKKKDTKTNKEGETRVNTKKEEIPWHVAGNINNLLSLKTLKNLETVAVASE